MFFRRGGWKQREPGNLIARLSVGGGDLLSHFRSTIGAVRLNFSVRNGKRWNPHAITTLVSFLVSLRSLTAAALSRAAPGSAGDFYRRGVLHAVCVSAINPDVVCRSLTAAQNFSRATVRPFSLRPYFLTACLCRLPATQASQVLFLSRKAFGILVLLGWDIAALAPATYRRRSLQRPSWRSYLGEGFVLRCFQHLS